MKKFTLIVFAVCILNASSAHSDNLNHLQWMQKWNTLALKTNLADRPFHLPGFPAISASRPGLLLKSASFTHRLDSVVTHQQAQGGVWNKENLTEFQFNSDNRSEIWTESMWDVDRQAWDLAERTEFSYDAGGLLLEISMLVYHKESNEFIPEMKLVMDYNQEARINSIIFIEEADGTETEQLMYLYFYTESGLPEAIEIFFHEDEWVEVFRIEYLYNAYDEKTADHTYFIVEDEKLLVGTVEYTIDTQGRTASAVYLMVNETSANLEKVSRTDYEYTVHGDISVLYDRDWNAELPDWEEKAKHVYEYDDNINVSDVIFPYNAAISDLMEADLLFSGKMPTAVKNYNYHDGNYVNTTNEIYHYSELTSFTGNPDSPSGLKVYPVPAGCCVTFHWAGNVGTYRLEVFHLSGSRLIDRNIVGSEVVDVEPLPSGIYLYRLSDDRGSVYSGKLLVK